MRIVKKNYAIKSNPDLSMAKYTLLCMNEWPGEIHSHLLLKVHVGDWWED